MSYTLELRFRPGVARRRILRYFAERDNFKFDRGHILYDNPKTDVDFSLKLQCGRNLALQKTVVSAEFEINYNRPSFFGIEAERELSAFVAAFEPKIHDDQMRGMRDGPYTGAGFLRGWNFGNMFAVWGGLRTLPDLKIESMPANALHAMWDWNYRRAGRSDICIEPAVMIFRIDGRLSRATFWGDGRPIWLPRVDYILVGRQGSGGKEVGVAPWSEVVELARRAGFDTAKDPLHLDYFTTPPAIVEWFAQVPAIDLKCLERIRPFRVLDEELVAAAREMQEEMR